MSWAKGVTRILWPSYVLSHTATRTRKHLVLLVTMHQLRVLRRAAGYRHSVHTGHGTPQYLPTHKGSCVTPERLKQHKIKLFCHKPLFSKLRCNCRSYVVRWIWTSNRWDRREEGKCVYCSKQDVQNCRTDLFETAILRKLMNRHRWQSPPFPLLLKTWLFFFKSKS